LWRCARNKDAESMPVSPKLAGKAVLAKPPYSTKTWKCLARRHKGTEGKPVNGEKQKDKKDFLCGLVREKRIWEGMLVSPKLASKAVLAKPPYSKTEEL